MRYVCSFCHERFEAEPAPLPVCPNCKAEAGIERVVGEPPNAMRYFGVFLLVTTALALGGVLIGATS